jgi:hypothetical protein
MQIKKDYINCLFLIKDLPKVREVWIEDGKQWRVLAIAKPRVRLFLSGINKFFMYYMETYLPKEIFHGFKYGRGVTTY